MLFIIGFPGIDIYPLTLTRARENASSDHCSFQLYTSELSDYQHRYLSTARIPHLATSQVVTSGAIEPLAATAILARHDGDAVAGVAPDEISIDSLMLACSASASDSLGVSLSLLRSELLSQAESGLSLLRNCY